MSSNFNSRNKNSESYDDLTPKMIIVTKKSFSKTASGNNLGNFITVQKGDMKIKLTMKNQNNKINKRQIDETIKAAINQKNSDNSQIISKQISDENDSYAGNYLKLKKKIKNIEENFDNNSLKEYKQNEKKGMITINKFFNSSEPLDENNVNHVQNNYEEERNISNINIDEYQNKNIKNKIERNSNNKIKINDNNNTFLKSQISPEKLNNDIEIVIKNDIDLKGGENIEHEININGSMTNNLNNMSHNHKRHSTEFFKSENDRQNKKLLVNLKNKSFNNIIELQKNNLNHPQLKKEYNLSKKNDTENEKLYIKDGHIAKEKDSKITINSYRDSNPSNRALGNDQNTVIKPLLTIINDGNSSVKRKEYSSFIQNSINKEDTTNRAFLKDEFTPSSKIENTKKAKENPKEKYIKYNKEITEGNNTDNNIEREKETISRDNIYLKLKINSIYKNCWICENIYPSIKLLNSGCNIHFLCHRCTKNYYEDAIENGDKTLKCPVWTCDKLFSQNVIKKIISEEHYFLLVNKIKTKDFPSTYEFYNAKLKSNIQNEKLKLYSEKHVIDINNNKIFFNYNKSKDLFCPKCKQDSLFSKTNTHFIKCLNCGFLECKYCLKEYTDNHINIQNSHHCKIYFRKEDENYSRPSNFAYFLLQLFFVFAIFYLTFVGDIIYISCFFSSFFCLKKNDFSCGNIFKLIFVIFFTIFFFTLSIPFIFILHPFFPIILAFTDF